jgi:hypothetical protein
LDRVLRDQVYTIAQVVRYWAEGRARGTMGANDLCGWCAICAAELHRQLTVAGITSEIHSHNSVWGSHCYVAVEDHIVDVTATQFSEFSNQPVVILHTREAQAYWFYQSDEFFTSADNLRIWQKRNKWPKHQLAYSK